MKALWASVISILVAVFLLGSAPALAEEKAGPELAAVTEGGKSKPTGTTIQKPGSDLIERGLTTLCNSIGTGFAWWNRETHKCLGIDFSSDLVYEYK